MGEHLVNAEEVDSGWLERIYGTDDSSIFFG